jgi:hypothetical protein
MKALVSYLSTHAPLAFVLLCAAVLAGPAVAEEPAKPAAEPAAESEAKKATGEIACRDLELKALLDRTDDVYRGTRSHARVTMRVVTEHWERELEIEAWSEGSKKSLMRIRSPKKEKGTATLMVDDNVWNYLPKVKRVIKVPSSMMGGSWMGSHFTNDDLVKQSRMAEDYSFVKSFEGEREGRKEIEVTCVPKEDAAIVWGKVVVIVDETSCLPVKQLFYDEDMALARTMTFEEPKTFGGRTLPTLMRVTPTDKPKESTEVRYLDISFDVDLPANTFSHRMLKR